MTRSSERLRHVCAKVCAIIAFTKHQAQSYRRHERATQGVCPRLASRAEFCCFTDVEGFKAYLKREVLGEVLTP